MIPISSTSYTPTKAGYLFLWYKTIGAGEAIANIKDATANLLMAQGHVSGDYNIMINTPIIIGHTYTIDYSAAGNKYFYFMPAKL